MIAHSLMEDRAFPEQCEHMHTFIRASSLKSRVSPSTHSAESKFMCIHDCQLARPKDVTSSLLSLVLSRDTKQRSFLDIVCLDRPFNSCSLQLSGKIKTQIILLVFSSIGVVSKQTDYYVLCFKTTT